MPIWLHLAFLWVANVAALIGGFMLGMFVHGLFQTSLPDVLNEKILVFIVFGMLPAALCMVLVKYVFRYAIPGRCPKCGGHAIYHPSRQEKAVFGGVNRIPISYHCKNCGYIHRTKVYEGSSDSE